MKARESQAEKGDPGIHASYKYTLVPRSSDLKLDYLPKVTVISLHYIEWHERMNNKVNQIQVIIYHLHG